MHSPWSSERSHTGSSIGPVRVGSLILLLSLMALPRAVSVRADDSITPDLRSASEKAIQTLQARSDGTWRVTKNPATGFVRMLTGAKSASYGTNPVQAAEAFLAANAEVFLPGRRAASPEARIALSTTSSKSFLGRTAVEFLETSGGLPVYGAAVTVMVDGTGRVVHVTSTADPRVVVASAAPKSFEDIDALVRRSRTNQTALFTATTNTLVIVPGTPPRLAYQTYYKVGDTEEPWEYLVDAITGRTLATHRMVVQDTITVDGAQPLATCTWHVGLATGEGAETVASLPGHGTLGGTNYTVSATASLAGGEDEDGDGYYDSYCLQIVLDGTATPGPATVHGRLTCNTTGQHWPTEGAWVIAESTGAHQYFSLDEAALPAEVTGLSGLDFTAELWAGAPRPQAITATNAASRMERTAAFDRLTARNALIDDSHSWVFDPNPVNTLDTTNLPRQYYSDDAVFSNAYVQADLTHLTPPLPGDPYSLNGRYAVMMNIEAPTNHPPTSSNTVFAYHRDSPHFEEVMCYHHVTRNQEYIQSLGFTNINNRQHAIDAHSYTTDGVTYFGAYYRIAPPAYPPGFGYLAFGEDAVNFAEDADVILHEYAHSIQDNSTMGKYLRTNDRGFGDETGAMGEGFGDYWACSCTYDQSIAHGFDPAIVAEWALPPVYWRRVDTAKHYPEDMRKDVHSDGELWSACLWDIFTAIDKSAADTLILASHLLVPVSPSFEDGAEAILVADDVLYDGAHATVISNIFTARGIFGTPSRGVLQLDASSYLADENGGPLTITVTRTGGSFGDVSVDYGTADGTAMESLDYTATNGVLTWTNGETRSKTFTVAILSDAIAESDETFTVALSNPNGAPLGDPASATVTIVGVVVVGTGEVIGGEIVPTSRTHSSGSSSSDSKRKSTKSDAARRTSGASGVSAGNGDRSRAQAGGTQASYAGGDAAASADATEPGTPPNVQKSTETHVGSGVGTPDDQRTAQTAWATRSTPLQLSLCPPFQLLPSERNVVGVRLNLLVGDSDTVTGLDLGIVANQVGTMRGVQMAIGNQSLRFRGLQLGLANQIGYLGPPDAEPRRRIGHADRPLSNAGLQIGLMNSVGTMSPWALDYAPGLSFSGVQLGVMNFADDMDGVQIGALANRADRVTGLQMSLLWNQARVLHGVQIGLVNSAGNGPLRQSLGGIPIVNAAF